MTSVPRKRVADMTPEEREAHKAHQKELDAALHLRWQEEREKETRELTAYRRQIWDEMQRSWTLLAGAISSAAQQLNWPWLTGLSEQYELRRSLFWNELDDELLDQMLAPPTSPDEPHD